MTHRPILTTDVETRPDQQAQIVTLKGKLLGSPEGYEMLEDIRERTEEGLTRICLVMSDVEMINSSGAGILASVYQAATGAGGSLYLVGLQERCRKVLTFMHLHEFAHFVDTVGDALES